MRLLPFLLLISTGIFAQNLPVQDLDSLYNTLTTEHPKLHQIRPRPSFDSLYKKIRRSFSGFSHPKKILEMTRLLASLNDGHTKLGLRWDTSLHFKRLPVGFYSFSDGIFIRRVHEKYKETVGMEVIKIGELDIATCLDRVKPYIHDENEWGFLDILPATLAIKEVLDEIGCTAPKDKEVVLTLKDGEGKITTAAITPLAYNERYTAVQSRNANSPLPLYLKNLNRKYWFEYLPENKAVYFQFNEVGNMEAEPLDAFVKRLFRFIDSASITRLIIDIRFNNGGDNTLNKSIIHALVQHPSINKKGNLYTLIGRNTFSAAISLATELEKHTEVIFAGEPTAAAPNHFGETKFGKLPLSKTEFLYSTYFWQGSVPWDKRAAVAPSITVTISSKEYKNNIDPVINKVLELMKE